MQLPFEANAVLGLLAAALWGGGDFAGSMAVKRAGSTVRAALAVIVIGHVLSFAVVASIAALTHDTFPHGAALAWAIGGASLSAISLVAFYLALADGHMGSAAAVSGLLCATVPAIVSAFTEGTPGARRLTGFLLAGIAIWMIASSTEDRASASRRAMTLSTCSGIGFGIYFVSLKYAAVGGVLWPMAAARTGSATTCAILLLIMTLARKREDPLSPFADASPKLIAIIATGAALDTGGNLSFLTATRMGRLDVAAVLASIYPASTILLAAWLLKEHTTTKQRAGMALALAAVVAITL